MANLPRTRKQLEDISLDKLLKYSQGNTFRLVRMAMDRAIELSQGRPHLIKNPSSDKETTIALEEISQGKIVFVKREPKEKAKAK